MGELGWFQIKTTPVCFYVALYRFFHIMAKFASVSHLWMVLGVSSLPLGFLGKRRFVDLEVSIDWCTNTMVHQCELHPYPYLLRRWCLISIFRLFLDLWPDFRAAVWRPFRAPFSSNVLFTESSRCLVSNLSLVNLELQLSRYLAWKGSDTKLKNSGHLPLKNSYLLIRS